MRNTFALLALSFAAFTASAHADTMNLTGTLDDGGTLTGTLDYTGASMTGWLLSISDGGSVYVFDSSSLILFPATPISFSADQPISAPGGMFPISPIQPTVAEFTTEEFVNVDGDDLVLNFSGSVMDFANAVICTDDNGCGLNVPVSNFTSGDGNISAGFESASVSATPEPSALVLLGTGMLGFAGAVRRRIKA